jgi:hypothetical protein
LVKSLGGLELTNATLLNDLDEKVLKSGRFADLDEVKRGYAGSRQKGRDEHEQYAAHMVLHTYTARLAMNKPQPPKWNCSGLDTFPAKAFP